MMFTIGSILIPPEDEPLRGQWKVTGISQGNTMIFVNIEATRPNGGTINVHFSEQDLQNWKVKR